MIIKEFESVRDAKVTDIWVDSDHSSIRLDLRLRIKNNPMHEVVSRIHYTLLQDTETNEKYNAAFRAELAVDTFPTWTSLATAIVLSAAKKVATITSKTTTDWFDHNLHMFSPIIFARTRVLNLVRQESSIPKDTAIEMCRTGNRNVQESVEVAKSKWDSFIAQKIDQMRPHPKDAWKAVAYLKVGLTGHHSKSDVMRFLLPNGEFSKTPQEYASVLLPHFSSVFNN